MIDRIYIIIDEGSKSILGQFYLTREEAESVVAQLKVKGEIIGLLALKVQILELEAG